MNKKYLAEFIGTFALSLVVLMAVVSTKSLPLAVPLIAGLTLSLFVYSIGSISGCHINPSVTLAQLSVKKISLKEAVIYIVIQFLGALLAMAVAKIFVIVNPMTGTMFSGKVFLAEMLGAFFFNFGIASVVYGKAKEQMSGLVVGGSLVLGVLIASLAGAAGILNPAVALVLNSFNFVYLFAPIVGAVLGFQVYRFIAE
ncbi:MAG TPA: aquaporin [Candidatus Udaeobacter sp.]|nr:aquaporin [Candidatus Udaeobacter sp.]